jgi:phenylalanyl-tRNA synthetase beta chain
VREVLAGAGLSEAMTSMLVAPGDHRKAGLPEDDGDVVRAADPLMREESVLRTSLLPGLLRAVEYNANHREPDVALFEVGHVYPPPRPGDVLPAEEERVAWAIAGEGASASAAVDALLELLDALRVDGARMVASSAPGLHPTRTAKVVGADGATVGWVGEVDPSVVAAHDVTGRVAWADVSLEVLHAHPRRDAEMRPVSRYPSTDIDLAFVVPDAVAAGDVAATLREAAGGLLERLALFDVFRGPQLGAGVRSLAYRLRFCAPDRTMTDDEVGAIRARCITAVESAHAACLRG